MKKQEKIDGLKGMLKVVRSKGFNKGKYIDGLCLIMYRYSGKYKTEFKTWFYKILPRRQFGDFRNYSWEPGAKAPRIKWLKEQIKKLEGKE